MTGLLLPKLKNMYRYFILLLVCFYGVLPAAKAQEKLPDFGKIDVADLQLKECSFYKGASAMYLIKTTNTVFDLNPYVGIPKVTTEYRVRIKIFTEAGFSSATVTIPYTGNSRITKITDLEGYMYTLGPDGNVITQKLDNDQVFNEKARGQKAHNKISFTFPGLQKGCIVEYRYKKINKNAYHIAPFFFQEELPTAYTKCSVTYPGYFADLQYHFVTKQPFDKDSSEKKHARSEYNTSYRAFTMHNVPAFKPEPLMTSLEDNLQRVEFAVLESVFFNSAQSRWFDYNAELLRSPYFGLQIKQDVPGSDSIINAVKAVKDTSAKIDMLYSYVKKRISWNGEQVFVSASLDDCLKDGMGSSAEMNILLLNLLRKAGIFCVPVLFSSHDNGKTDKTFATLGQFNGVDVLAADGSILYVLDCTQKNLSYKTTPLNIINSEVFMVDREKSGWVSVVDKRNLMNTDLSVNAEIDSAGLMHGAGRVLYTAIAKAQELKDEEADKKKDSKELVDDNSVDLKIDSSFSIHHDDDNDTLIHNLRFHASTVNTGDLYFINPFMFSMFKKNPFSDSARYSDIDFGCNQSYTTSIRLNISPVFNVEEIPKSVLIRTEDSSILFRQQFFSAGNQLLVRNTFTINRAVFDKEEYTGVKSFFDKVYTLLQDQVLLKKKE